MYQKNFEDWHPIKTKIDSKKNRIPFNEREVWWCTLGANVGDEQDGKGKEFRRPALVLKKYSSSLFLAIPLSTKIKESKFYHVFEFKGVQQSALLSHLKSIDAKRITHRIGRMPKKDYNDIMEKIRKFIL